MKYKAFISYSHTHRAALAAALEEALHRFGIPDHEREGLRLFRDSTNLSASPELWPDIQRALDESDYFLLLASPEAAASPWVQREVAHWREQRGSEQIILALADGEIAWGANDFDFGRTTALPQTISGAFATVPFWVDLRGIKAAQFDVSYPAFGDGVATISARLQGRDKDELIGIYVANRLTAEAERLAAEAELALRDEFPQRSVLLGSKALKLTHERGLPRVPAAEMTLRKALSCFGGRPLGDLRSDAEGPAAFSADNRWLATIGSDGDAQLWALAEDGSEPAPVTLQDKAPLQKLMFTQNPRWLITASEPTQKLQVPATALRLWDAKTNFESWHDLAAADSSTVTCSIVNKAGSHLAAQFGDSAVQVWQLPDLEDDAAPELLFKAPAGPVTALAFAPEPLRLVTGARDGSILIWNVSASPAASVEPIARLAAGGAIEQLIASPNGHVLVARVEGKPLQLWRLDDDDIEESRVEFQVGDTRIFNVHFSPQGSLLICLGDASYAFPVEESVTAPAFHLNATGGIIWKHSFSEDEQWLVTATGLLAYEELAQAVEPEYEVRLWDVARGQPWLLSGHKDIVTGVLFTPDGTRVISSSLDRSIRVWNCEVAQKFQSARLVNQAADDAPGGLDQHELEHVSRSFRKPAVRLAADDQVFNCIVSPDGFWLLTISKGAATAARLWFMIDEPFPAAPFFVPMALAKIALALPHPQRWLLYSELARASGVHSGFSARDTWFFLGDDDVGACLFDLRTKGVRTLDLKGKGANTSWAWWSPDERWFIATSKTEETAYFEMRLWDLNAVVGAAPEGSAVASSHAFPPLQFSPDSRWLLGLQNEAGVLWDLHDAEPLSNPLRVPGAKAVVDKTFSRDLRMAFSPCGRWLINAANEDGIWLHDLRQPDLLKPVCIIPIAETSFLPSIETICTDEHGRLMMAGGSNGFGRVYRISDKGSAEHLMDLPGHKSIERAVFSGNGRWLITRDFEAIHLWDVEARECRCSILKQEGEVRLGQAVSFLANDRWAVISKWKAVILIDLATRESAAAPITLPGHEFQQVNFWFTPDHRWLVTADFPFEELRGIGPRPAVQIWDLLSPHPEVTAVRLPGLEQGVKRINISSDGRWLSTTSDDGVRLWPLGVSHLLELAHKTVGRDFTPDERQRYRIA
jgi:WD40 repeat protein